MASATGSRKADVPPSLRAKRSNPAARWRPGLLRRCAPRNDEDQTRRTQWRRSTTKAGLMGARASPSSR
ncbi:MAG: hypothetical protein DCF30_12310 [Hyphomicrobiales bacterium]|nr:MAG: hypothetical protein DCF30_12310 [Hyphomicrobiales bacterium]